MANRPVYVVGNNGRWCRVFDTEFDYVKGMAKSQKTKCSMSLRNAFKFVMPECHVLEVSRYSEHPLGNALSAFNLTITTKDGKKMPVECAFQGSKVMKEYGQLSDLYEKTAAEAKADPRRISGTLMGFQFDGMKFELTPRTAFYNWIYIRALSEHPELGDQLMEFDAFTDIAFNPQKASNCQAEACTYYVALRRNGLLEKALQSKEEFVEVLYQVKKKENPVKKPAASSVFKPAVQEVKESFHYEVGQTVKHPKFGEGVVKKTENSGGSTIVSVAFGDDLRQLDGGWLAKFQ